MYVDWLVNLNHKVQKELEGSPTMKRKQEDTERHVKRIRTDTTVFPFYTLPYDLKYHIAGFLLDFTDDGFEAPKEDINLLVKCIWGGTNPSKHRAICGLAWPEKDPRCMISVYDAARRGNLPLMKHLIAAKGFKGYDINPYKGAIEFGHVPHLEWLLDFEPSQICETFRWEFERSKLNVQCYSTLQKVHKSMVNFIMSQETYSKDCLIISAVYSGIVPIVDMFLSWGWDFSFLSTWSFPAVRARDSAPMLDWLVKKGVLQQPSESRLIGILYEETSYMNLSNMKWYCSHFHPTSSKLFCALFKRVARMDNYSFSDTYYLSLKWMFDEGFPYDRKECVDDNIWSSLDQDQQYLGRLRK